MPRLPPSLLLKAARQSKHLTRLLIECRDLPSAGNELRWLREHARETSGHEQIQNTHRRKWHHRMILSSYIHRRSVGEPLQYILGNQPFGDLEILCRKDVLIPRPETEMYTMKLAGHLNEVLSVRTHTTRRGLRILDLCTGTSCIALLLYSLLRSSATITRGNEQGTVQLQVTGLDISPTAVNLAQENRAHNIARRALTSGAEQDVTFHVADVLDLGGSQNALDHESNSTRIRSLLSSLVTRPRWRQDDTWDAVICNPPYISETDFAVGGTTTRSVRKFEPKLALVPPDTASNGVAGGDAFYPHIIQTALAVDARVIVMEIGDIAQAQRVFQLADQLVRTEGTEYCMEIWRDDGSISIAAAPDGLYDRKSDHSESSTPDRAIVIWRAEWAAWRKETFSD